MSASDSKHIKIDYKSKYQTEIKLCFDVLVHLSDLKETKTSIYTNTEFDSQQTLFESLCNTNLLWVKARSKEEANVLLFITRMVIDENWCAFYELLLSGQENDEIKEIKDVKTAITLMCSYQNLSTVDLDTRMNDKYLSNEDRKVLKYGLCMHIDIVNMKKLLLKI